MEDDAAARGGHSRTPSSSAAEPADAEEGVSVRCTARRPADLVRKGLCRTDARNASSEVRVGDLRALHSLDASNGGAELSLADSNRDPADADSSTCSVSVRALTDFV